MNIKIMLKYISNVFKKDISVFQFDSDDAELFSKLILNAEKELSFELKNKFDAERLFIVTNGKFEKLTRDALLYEISKKDEITICYSEIIASKNAYKIAECDAKSSGKIEFYIFPREHNHIHTPHVRAVFNNENMDITIKNPNKFAGGFSGNKKTKNEECAIKYVKKKKKLFLRKWNEFVNSQF